MLCNFRQGGFKKVKSVVILLLKILRDCFVKLKGIQDELKRIILIMKKRLLVSLLQVKINQILKYKYNKVVMRNFFNKLHRLH